MKKSTTHTQKPKPDGVKFLTDSLNRLARSIEEMNEGSRLMKNVLVALIPMLLETDLTPNQRNAIKAIRKALTNGKKVS